MRPEPGRAVPGGHPVPVPGGRPLPVPGGRPLPVPGGRPLPVPGGRPLPVPGGRPLPRRVPVAGRGPCGTVAVTGAVGGWTWTSHAWWAGVPVPRAAHPSDLLHPGSAVPVTGPAARDADGDRMPDTLVVEGPGGMSLWTDLDGDGLADRVTVLGGPAGDRPADDDPDTLGVLDALLHRLAGP